MKADHSVIKLNSVTKSFGGRPVLQDVNLEIRPGEVHGLIGQNGSGKSTLIKILSGHHAPDPGLGRLTVRGEAVDLPLTPSRSTQLGLAFVHQELPTAAGASVMENLRVGRFHAGVGWKINWRVERQQALKSLREFGLDVDPDTMVDELSEVERAMLAILRALEGLSSDRPGLLVLDEPTAYLPRDSVQQLFTSIRAAAQRGHGVVVVTHRLEELLAITDRISVLRDGKIAATQSTAETTERELVRAILGFEVEELYPSLVEELGEPVLTTRDIEGDRLGPLDLVVRAGEIVGVTGLMGSGYEEIPYLLFGARKGKGGSVSISGAELPQAGLRPHKAMRSGMALLPADRHGASCVLDATVQENVTLPTLGRYVRGGFIRSGEEHRRTQKLLARYDVRPREPWLNMRALSGGNQQKALLAKWFDREPKVLILHEPTQGVDIGSRKTIFGHIGEAAAAGVAVIIASSEYEDLANLCTRVLVFRNGNLAAKLSGEQLTEARIVEQCMLDDSLARESS